jgi:hypothetical protein
MDDFEIASIFLGVFVVFGGLLILSMHLVNRHKKDLKDSDPEDVNEEVV